jgi:hypothetical protein
MLAPVGWLAPGVESTRAAAASGASDAHQDEADGLIRCLR